MYYPFYICLGLLPSLIWLSYYLRKDKHPEPTSIVLNIFIWGMLLAPLAIILELLLVWLLNPQLSPGALLAGANSQNIIKAIIAGTLIPALVEETLKYSIVRQKFLKYSEFDEPTDVIIYLIIAGLGFAAIENLLVLNKITPFDFGQGLSTIGFRFVGATLVHALASGMAGFWLAKALINRKKRLKYISFGLLIAIIFHACYNYLIIIALSQQNGNQQLFFFALIALLIGGMALFISFAFKKLKKQSSTCQINPET